MDDPQSSSSKGNDKESGPVGHRRRTCLIGTLLAAPILILAWIFIQGPVMTYVRELRLPAPVGGLLQSETPEADDVSVDFATFLPPGTVLFDTLRGDLDGDGSSERALIFNDEQDPYEPGKGGVLVLEDKAEGSFRADEHRLPSEGMVTDAAIRDINRDGTLELLIYKSSEDESNQYLCIYQWDGSEYVTLGPQGGPLEGEQAFVSAYYPPEVRNVDSTGIDEIVVFEDDPSSQRLKAIVYRWNGEAYTGVDWIIMLGPARPSSETE